MAGVLRIITQAVLTATPRKRPPLGLLVIVKLTLSENKQHKDIVQNKYHPEEQLLPIISLLMQDWYCNNPYSSTLGCVRRKNSGSAELITKINWLQYRLCIHKFRKKCKKKRIPKDTHFFKLFQNSKEFPHTRGFAFVLEVIMLHLL